MKKNILRTLTTVLVLGGSLACFSGCGETPTRRSTGESIDDAAVTAKVKTAFAQDSFVKATDVKVDTFKGTVQLNGWVNSAEEKKRAEEIARTIEGVIKVDNKLTLKTSATP